TCHILDYERELQLGNIGTSSKPGLAANSGTPAIDSVFASQKWIRPNNTGAYPRNHMLQKRFVRDILDCVAIDLLPLDFIERPTFIQLIRNLNQSIRLFSRRTIGRNLRKHFLEFQSKFKKIAASVAAGSFHLILDMWTDKLKSSMIGFKSQFINSNWKLMINTIGFRHLPDSHTGRAIRNVLEEVMSKTFDIPVEKVGFICGDNASNVTNACKAAESIPQPNTDDIDFSDGDDEEEWEDFDEFFQDSQNAQEDAEDCYNEIITELSTWANTSLTKIPCFAHLLQLAIKDAIKSNDTVSGMVGGAKLLKKYFHSSPYWYDRLKLRAGKGLKNQADTRWNTVYYVFDRLSEPKFREALEQVLAETRKSKKQCKVSFSSYDYERIALISKLLAPLTALTNELQADKVTSSLVIPGLSFAYSSICQIDVEDDNGLRDFQLALCKCLRDRFGSGVAEQEIGSINRRIQKNAVFANENLIIAS
ncbi:unnamed protein product, partial [Allacma fusca]